MHWRAQAVGWAMADREVDGSTCVPYCVPNPLLLQFYAGSSPLHGGSSAIWSMSYLATSKALPSGKNKKVNMTIDPGG
jgi:hypothetical protein